MWNISWTVSNRNEFLAYKRRKEEKESGIFQKWVVAKCPIHTFSFYQEFDHQELQICMYDRFQQMWRWWREGESLKGIKQWHIHIPNTQDKYVLQVCTNIKHKINFPVVNIWQKNKQTNKTKTNHHQLWIVELHAMS